MAERYADVREGVRALCAQFPAAYFREVDAHRTYPEAFVTALTKAGWLAALIPQEYGGSGLGVCEASVIMEEINRAGGNAGACHGQMYNMGTLLRHGSEAQKRSTCRRSPRRAAPAVDGRDRAHRRHRHHQIKTTACARATATSSTARRSGSRASSTRT
jgi:alkylation response protein AidB-like acyl-CoA dehydrogenase